MGEKKPWEAFAKLGRHQWYDIIYVLSLNQELWGATMQFRATNDIPAISVVYLFFYSLNLIGNMYLALNTWIMLCDLILWLLRSMTKFLLILLVQD